MIKQMKPVLPDQIFAIFSHQEKSGMVYQLFTNKFITNT